MGRFFWWGGLRGCAHRTGLGRPALFSRLVAAVSGGRALGRFSSLATAWCALGGFFFQGVLVMAGHGKNFLPAMPLNTTQRF